MQDTFPSWTFIFDTQSLAANHMQAYMLVDMFMFLLPFTPGDYLFVGHHIMTAAYMLMSLQINRGGLSCLILMALGESTSLFQNSWLIARELRRDNQVRHCCSAAENDLLMCMQLSMANMCTACLQAAITSTCRIDEGDSCCMTLCMHQVYACKVRMHEHRCIHRTQKYLHL